MRRLRPPNVSADTPTSELLRSSVSRAGLSGVAFGLLMALGNGLARGAVAAVFFTAFMFLFFAGQMLSQRRSARQRARDGAPPLATENRPSYVPAFWPDDTVTRWSMRTPRRALVNFTGPGAIFGGLLFWRIADNTSFVRALGEGTSSIILVAGPIMLGFTWYYGIRAWAEMRAPKR